MKEVVVPDIGDFTDVPIVEVLVQPGDQVAPEDPLITLESDKASMDVPSPFAGVVKELKVGVGDTVSAGSPIALLDEGAADGNGAGPTAPSEAPPADAPPPRPEIPPAAPQTATADATAQPPPAAPAEPSAPIHAGPAVRAYARQHGVDLTQVQGTGPRGRIRRGDVEAYASGAARAPAPAEPAAAPAAAAPGGLAIAPLPQIDFSVFGPVRSEPLSRIKRLSGRYLHRNWVTIPHVTQNDEADITELEAFRKASADAAKEQGVRLTMLAFIVTASVAALKRFPTFNASLDANGDNLILKDYYNVGFAADTPNGLVVPVIKEADRKGVIEVARDLGELSATARDGKLRPDDMQGGTFTISSLGGIGGTSFTPIVNAPEVAILGVTRHAMRPQWDGSQFVPRLMLPLSLSYDHRVIDGADAARFTAYLATLLGDMRRVLL